MIDYEKKEYEAKLKFKILCQKYSIKSTEYGEKYRRDAKACIRSIILSQFVKKAVNRSYLLLRPPSYATKLGSKSSYLSN